MDEMKIKLSWDGIEQFQAGAKKASDGVKTIGQAAEKTEISAGQLRVAFQQLPAQLQDFFIQVQGGQSVLTALSQQGSQVAGAFGGVGNAISAIASRIGPLGFALGGVAVAAGVLAKAFVDGAAESKAYNRALILSGNAAGVTAAQLQDLARAQSQVVGTQGQAAEALAALAATGKVAAAQLAGAAEAATRLARVGIPLEDTYKKFVSLGKDPLKAIIDLNDAENFLTISVYKQVKALTDQGKAAEAAAVAQAEYSRVGNERAKELASQLGLLERAWQRVKDGAKDAWDAMLNIGRPESPNDRAAKIRAELDKLEQDRVKSMGASAAYATPKTAYVIALERELQALENTARASKAAAEADAKRAAEVKAAIKADEDAAKAAKALAAERERDAAALERAAGLSGTYGKDLAELNKLRLQGRLTEAQYVTAVEKLIAVQPVVREQMEAIAAAQKNAAAARNDEIKAEERRIEALIKSGEQVAAQVLKLQDEEKAVTLAAAANISLAEAVERVVIARLAEAEAKARAAEDYGTADALRLEIQQREKLADLIGSKQAREVLRKGAEEAARDWKRATEDIERSLTDALLRGFESGKGFATNLRDTLVNMFKTLVLRPILQPVMANAAGSIGSVLGLPTSALASTGATGSAAGSLGSLLGLGGLSSAFSGGASLALSGAGGTGLALQGAGSLLGSGAYAQGLAQGAGALAPWALGAAAGIFGGRAISGGYSAFGGSGNAAVNIGTLAGAVFGGPIGAAIGGAIGGLVNRAFGMKAKEVRDTGLTGTASVDGFLGQAFANWFQKGGLFRSNRSGTDFSAVSAEQDATLDAGIKALYATTADYAKVLGLPVEAVKGYSAAFKVVWGKTEEENQKAIQEAFVGLGEQLAGRYASQLAPLQKAGETVAATLQRLAGLQVFSNSLNQLGGVFSRLAGASVDAREQMIALAGGMDNLSQQALAFAQNYYNRDEIAGLKARDVQSALSAAGITTDLNSREQFRALVEGLDPTTATGRQQLAVLLQLQGSFATVADYLTETGQTLNQAATQAPATDALVSPLLSGVSQQLQLAQQSMEAQYETRDATLQVLDAVKELTATVAKSGGSGWVSGYRQPEVQMAY